MEDRDIARQFIVFWDLDWKLVLMHCIKLISAFAMALPIAWERERRTRIMGIRTFPLVAMASCGYVLVAAAVVGPASDAQARIVQGLITGMGFLGGGAILKEGTNVRGTATAASIWSTGAVGGAVAYGRFELALVIGAMTFLTLRFLTSAKQRFGGFDPPDGQGDESSAEEESDAGGDDET
jgi:putative Mg2+ transporter-C (MgtC) family protein